ncbi:hypothetical protein [Thermococcus sp.]|uniref:hypothetical protein n=1 Tax=Thermococcus sp. TaxID=35749 RepID=UPI002635524F|nr:hypothetical protein [Thermococcus sp.]
MRRALAFLLILLVVPFVGAVRWGVVYNIKGSTYIQAGSPMFFGNTLYQAGLYEINYTKNSFYVLGLDPETGKLKFGEELAFSYNGTRIWGKSFSGGSPAILRKLPNGDILLLFAAKRPNSMSAIIVAELRKNGSVAWAKYYLLYGSFNNKVVARELIPIDAVVSDGEIYLLAETIEWSKPQLVLLKLSQTGDVIWIRSYVDSYAGLRPKGLAIGPDGNILALVGSLNPILLWFTKNGEIIKSVALDFGTPAGVVGPFVHGDEIYIAGHVKENGYFIPFIMAIDKTGNVLWAEKFPDAGYDFVSVKFGDKIYILGKAVSAFQKSNYNRRVWILSLDRKGKPVWNILTGDSAMIMDEYGGMTINDALYVVYYRNFIMARGLVFMSVGKDGSVPCSHLSPEIKPTSLTVTIKQASLPKTEDLTVKVLQVSADVNKLDISSSSLCPGSSPASTSSPRPTSSSSSSTSSSYPPIIQPSQTHTTKSSSSPIQSSSTHYSSTREITSSSTSKKSTCGPGLLIILPLILLLKRRSL